MVVMDAKAQNIKTLMGLIKVLIVEDEHYSRKVIRTLLTAIGCSKIHDAADGPSGLEAIVAHHPDIVLLDWQMPGMDGAEFIRKVRSPGVYPKANLPIIMLTDVGLQSRVTAAVQLGVHEFLLKPVSSHALLTRVLTVLTKPRNMIRRGNYYGPEPRKLSSYKPETDTGHDRSPMDLPTYMIFNN